LFAEALVDVVAEGVELAVEFREHGVGIAIGRVQRLHGDRVGVAVRRREGRCVAGVELALVDRVARGHAVGYVRDHGAAGTAEGEASVAGVVVLHRQYAAGPGRTLRSLRPGRAFRPLRPGRALGTVGALRPGGSAWALRPGRTL